MQNPLVVAFFKEIMFYLVVLFSLVSIECYILRGFLEMY